MSTIEQTVKEEQERYEAAQKAREDGDAPDGTATGPDADKGKLFEVPRVAILIDDTDPTVLKLAFSGGIEFERGSQQEADFYNKLAAGKNIELAVTAFVAGAKTSHRRDAEGNVDAVVQTKSLIVTDVVIV